MLEFASLLKTIKVDPPAGASKWQQRVSVRLRPAPSATHVVGIAHTVRGPKQCHERLEFVSEDPSLSRSLSLCLSLSLSLSLFSLLVVFFSLSLFLVLSRSL